ncbi:MAG TPA: tyrosine-protein phosphatase [Bryobacteraceae bacterium]|nr:tyrosine-protein phosphatase [Bryobacteraceae bacterium]
MDVQARSRRAFVFVLALPAFAASPVQGIRNFHQVNEHVYRGGQPTDEGFAALSKLGVRTVIDLREAGERSKAEEAAVTSAGMKYVNVPMTGLIPPTESEISKILGLMENESAGPVFVHCRRGADRTGAVIAAYRIDHDRWENTHALSEAKEMGMSFFQYPRKSFIRDFQARVVEAKGPAAPATAGVAAQ